MKKNICLLGLLLSCVLFAGGTWQLGQTPANEVLNGISYPNESYAFAVGNNGTIVKFQSGDNGSLMTSGTTKDLYDIYATDGNTAIAAGEDTVLIWDGISWTSLFESDTGTPYTANWITPEKDVYFYESVGQPLSVVCSYFPGAAQQPLCRALQDPVMTYCGNSGDIKVFTRNGDIRWVDNNMGDLTDDSMPIHDDPGFLFLTAIWAAPWNCLPGSIEPLEAFAINNTNDFYRFDGSDWVNMNVNVPNDQVLTWIGGAPTTNVIAVGYKPDGNGGNQGVVWEYDGQNWTENTNLPLGTTGLTDIAFNTGLPDLIFADGFEGNVFAAANAMNKGVDILASAESGKYLRLTELFPQIATDVSVKKTLLTPLPIGNGDQITIRTQVTNLGSQDATDFRLVDGYYTFDLTLVNDGCGLTQINHQQGWKYRDKNISLLAAGDFFICDMVFEVAGSGYTIYNFAGIMELANDINYHNDRSHLRRTSEL